MSLTLSDIAARHAPPTSARRDGDVRNLRGYHRTRSNRNGDDTRDRIVQRCRALMIAGHFRPAQVQICNGISVKAVRYHFRTLGDLYEEALDEGTKAAILGRLMPNGPWPAAEDCARIVRAVVVGSLAAPQAPPSGRPEATP
jgi:hypothetical protein